MGKFNYTNITGYRSASLDELYRRSSPKDCCQRPNIGWGDLHLLLHHKK